MEENQPLNSESPQLSKRERRELRRMERRSESSSARRKNIGKRLGVWVVVLLLVGGGIWGMVKLAQNSGGDLGGGSLTGDISSSDWVKGNRDAEVKLVEYSDFQCPACAFYQPWLKQLSNELGDDLALVYRHFPLTTLHRNAQAAAYAAEAAGRQGKFWEMHDILFEKQNEWDKLANPRDKFFEFANTLGLNREQFERDMNSDEAKDKVAGDVNSGTVAAIQGTPTFFLNGKRLDNPTSYENFKAIVQNEIQN